MTFIDELIIPFIVAGAPTNPKDFAFGQIYWAPVYYPHKHLELWRPNSVDQKLHTARDFNIAAGVTDAFKKPLPYTFHISEQMKSSSLFEQRFAPWY